MRELLAFFPGDAVAREPKLPIQIDGEFRAEFDEFALVLQTTKHRDVEQYDRVGIGPVEFAQSGVAGALGIMGAQRGVMNDRDFGGREIVLVGEDTLGHMAVGNDVPAKPERANEKPGQRPAGAHGADDGGARQAFLDETGVAIRHAPHAKDEGGGGFFCRLEQAGGKPIEMAVEGLEGFEGEGLVFGIVAEGPARAEGQQSDLMAGPGRGGAEENGLAFCPATAEIILDDENFHCSANGCGNIYQSMKIPFVNLLVRWLVLALGVVLSTKLVHGIHYDTETTLAVVVVILSLFNTILKPLLLLFTLPFIVLSLGLGVWLINAFLFYFTGKLVEGFHVDSFGAALWGALIVSVTNLILTRMLLGSALPKPPGSPRQEAKKDDVIDV